VIDWTGVSMASSSCFTMPTQIQRAFPPIPHF
jgi:hypothetical protein